MESPQRESSSSNASSLIPSSLVNSPSTSKHKYLSYLLMVVSCVAWVSGYIYSNNNNLHPVETSILRGFMITVVSYCICWYQKIDIDLHSDVKTVMIRNAAFLAQGFVITTIQFYIPLGLVHTIGITGPIYVTIYQYILQQKKPHAKQVIGMSLTFLGVILMANGRILSSWFDPSYEFISDFQNYSTDNPVTIAICCIVYCAFMAVWAYGVYATNMMKASPHAVNFLFGAKLYLISSLLYPILLQTNQQVSAPIFYEGIVWTGVLLAAAEITFMLSIVYSENIGLTIMLGSSTVLVAYVISIFGYHQKINMFCLLGSALVIIGISRIILHHI